MSALSYVLRKMINDPSITTSQFEKATKSAVQERKIRVIWLAAEEPPADNKEEANGTVSCIFTSLKG